MGYGKMVEKKPQGKAAPKRIIFYRGIDRMARL
jgi:hypothetical protein